MGLRARNKLALVKLESTEGVDSSPTGTDFLTIAGDITTALNPDRIQNNESRGGLGSGEDVIGAFRPTITLPFNLRGSGTPATPQPAVSALFKSAALIETLSSTPFPATADTTASGGTTTTVTIDLSTGNGADWPTGSGLASGLIGAPILLSGNPATATWDVIQDYEVVTTTATITLSRTYGSALDTSTHVSVPAFASWTPGAPSPHPSVTNYNYYDGVLEKYVGCRANLQFNFQGGNRCGVSAALSGNLVSRTDASVPTVSTVEQSPPIWVNGLMTVDKVEAAVGALSLDLGNTGQFPTNPNAISGQDPYIIGSRAVAGNMNPLLTLVATRNLFAKLTAQTKVALAAILGAKTGSVTAGTRFALFVPQAKIMDDPVVVDNVVLRENVPFQAAGFSGEFVLTHF